MSDRCKCKIKICIKKKPEIRIKKKLKICIKKKIDCFNAELKQFLEANYMVSIPTKAELRKIVNCYIVANNLQQQNRSRQNINLDDQLKLISGLKDDSTTIYNLLDAIIMNSGIVSD